MTIHIPQSASSGVYLIDLASNVSTQTSHVPFNLTVLNAEIQVFGNVTIDSKVYLEGVTLDVIPTHIVFKSNTTGETYQAKVHRFTDTDVAPGRTGNYSIMLPNQQNYHVEFLCFTFDHFIPVARVASNVDRGHYTVSCGDRRKLGCGEFYRIATKVGLHRSFLAAHYTSPQPPPKLLRLVGFCRRGICL